MDLYELAASPQDVQTLKSLGAYRAQDGRWYVSGLCPDPQKFANWQMIGQSKLDYYPFSVMCQLIGIAAKAAQKFMEQCGYFVPGAMKPTPKALQLGILQEPRVNKKGEAYIAYLYGDNWAQFLISNRDAINRLAQALPIKGTLPAHTSRFAAQGQGTSAPAAQAYPNGRNAAGTGNGSGRNPRRVAAESPVVYAYPDGRVAAGSVSNIYDGRKASSPSPAAPSRNAAAGAGGYMVHAGAGIAGAGNRFPKLGIPDHARIIDVETTGVSDMDEVIELAVMDLFGNLLYHQVFRPWVPVGEEARSVNHISDAELGSAPDFGMEFPKILKLLSGHPVIGHNMDFLWKMLSKTAAKHSGPGAADALMRACSVMLDSRAITQRYLQVKSFSLGTLCQMLGWNGEEKHRAAEDCKEVLWLLRALEQRPFEQLC